ncbi:MAG TPA: type VI secretion system baseplate subunit TssF [Burkholderiaceae bacterium]|nr:type VI secretion system baseplate subunit TssF [Burkholderiaceae bacterium]
MDPLLAYYERELNLLREGSREFKRKYPRVAGKMLVPGEAAGDPLVQGMVESFALTVGRIAKRLDDDYPKFTEALLESLYPHYMRPIPSCSIACLDGGADASDLGAKKCLPRGTILRSGLVKGTRCLFQTTSDVPPSSVRLSEARFSPIIDAPASVQLPAGATAEISVVLDMSRLKATFHVDCSSVRFYIDGEPSFCAALRDTLFMRVCGAYAEAGGDWHALATLPIRSVGFSEDEALIPFPARSHSAYRLLTEYFVFPEKFNFLDIDLTEILARLPANCRSFTLHLAVKNVAVDSSVARALKALSVRNFVLRCTPIVNLFRRGGVPIQIDGKKAEYALLADNAQPAAYEIHSVVSARLKLSERNGDEAVELQPFYGRHHGQGDGSTGRYWITRRDDITGARAAGHELRIALVDGEMDPLALVSQTLSTELLCSNRDLPTLLTYGDTGGDLAVGDGNVAPKASLLRKPGPSYRFESGNGAHWRLISHLALNHRALSDVGLEEFRKMLTLYDLPQSPATQRQIQGVCGLQYKVIMAWVPGEPCAALMPGIEVRMTLDEEAFVGGGIHLFAEVMDRFFGLYCQINVFSQLLVLSKRTGEELLRCPPRSVTTNLA